MSTSDNQPAALPEKPGGGGHKGLIITAIVVVVALIAGAIVWATQRGSDSGSAASGQSGQNVTVKIGTSEAGAKFWPIFIKKAAAQGITVEKVAFSDYNQPNRALSQGQIDMNYFQHIFFLANYNKENNDNLVPLASTYIVPLSVYSKTHNKISEIPDGGKIAIPNDATNQGRALLVLQKAGLVSLKNGGSPLSTPADIVADKSKVTVTPVDAAQTVTALPSVDGSVVNNGFALDAKLDPKKALFSDDPKGSDTEPYINILAVRHGDQNNATYKKLAEIWHDREVVQAVETDSGNTAVIVKGKSQADLQKILDNTQSKLK